MFQQVLVVGHVGRDAELRYTPDGTAVASFSVASTRKWNNTDGTKGEETTWFRVSVWRKLAETCSQYVKKGMLVLVEGQMKPDKASGGPRVYQKQDGSYAASYELTAQNVRFLSSRGEAAAATPEAPENGAAPAPEEENIPF